MYRQLQPVLIRRLAGAVLGLAAGMLAGASAVYAASDYPAQQPIRLIVPYPAGGGTDYFARTVSERMGKELGQKVVVENRPGAATIIGADTVARSKPDGYTILLGDNATYAVNPSLYAKLPYDPLKDLDPVTLTARFALLLVVHPSAPVNTVEEFIEWVKANPGKIDFGSPGTGSPHHLAMELLEQQAGIDLTHIPYKGGAPATQDLLAGVFPTMFLDLPTAAAHIQAGKLKALAVASDKPISAMPELPTVADAAKLPGFEAWAWQGFAVPKGTPEDVVRKINEAFAITAKDGEIIEKMRVNGTDLIPSTPEEMRAYMESETRKWAEAIRNANIKIEQ